MNINLFIEIQINKDRYTLERESNQKIGFESGKVGDYEV